MTDTDPDGVLNPDELAIEDSDDVVQLDEYRYLIAVDETDDSEAKQDPTVPSLPAEDAYAISVLARFDGNEPATYMASSDDVTQPFEEFLRWYAKQIAPDRPAEKVIAVLLSHTTFTATLDA